MEKTTKKQTVILYVKKDQGILYLDNIAKSCILNFPTDVIDNLEILNIEKLQLLVSEFIKKHNVLAKNIYFVLDKELVFEKEINADSPIEEAESTEEFLDMVPFEKILKKVYKTKTEVKIIVTNKDLIEEFKNSFEKLNIKVKSVTPFSMIEKLMLKNDFVAEIAFSKLAILKQNSLLEDSEKREIKINYSKPEIKNPRFIALVSSFVVLLIILIVLIFTQVLVSKPKKLTIVNNPAPVLKSTGSATLISTPTSSPQ